MTPEALTAFISGGIWVFLLWILPMIITYRVTKRKNRNYRLWTLSAVFFGWLSAILGLVVTKLQKEVNY